VHGFLWLKNGPAIDDPDTSTNSRIRIYRSLVADMSGSTEGQDTITR